MLEWYRTDERYDRDRLQDNLSHIRSLISKARTVLLAWGALAGRTESSINWFDRIQEEIAETSLTTSWSIALARPSTAIQNTPFARGKYKMPKTVKFVPWGEK